MGEHVFTVRKQSNGREIFAKVDLEASTGGDGYGFVFAADPSVPSELVVAADQGAQYAWSHQTAFEQAEGLEVRLHDLDFSPSQTTPNAVAYATCHAVWIALGIEGELHLNLAAEKLELPDA